MNSYYQSTQYTDEQIEWILDNADCNLTWKQLGVEFSKTFKMKKTGNAIRKIYEAYLGFERNEDEIEEIDKTEPKVLIYDIETAPILAYVWGLWENNVGLNQIQSDWYVLSWSAKWLGSPADEVMYMDGRNSENIEDDFEILSGIWKLLDEADIVVTQNGKKFDEKKLNARFILHGFEPPSTYRHVDTHQIAKSKFGFTSNRLAYMTDKLCTKYKKLDHAKFSGFELWKQCLSGNIEAWKEMELYNKYDVLSLEELYLKMRPWDKSINYQVYNTEDVLTCSCGSTNIRKNGFYYTNTSKFQKYRCMGCGTNTRGGTNLLHNTKKANLKRPI